MEKKTSFKFGYTKDNTINRSFENLKVWQLTKGKGKVQFSGIFMSDSSMCYKL